MENKKEMDTWAKEAIPILKKNGYIENNNWKIMTALCFILLGVFIAIVFVYAINSDAFKSVINQDVACPNITIPDCVCPDITIPACPTPYITCNNTCLLPQNFSIKLNSS